MLYELAVDVLGDRFSGLTRINRHSQPRRFQCRLRARTVDHCHSHQNQRNAMPEHVPPPFRFVQAYRLMGDPDPLRSFKSYAPCHPGLDPESSVFLDSRSPHSRGQVYPCESRGGNNALYCD